MGSRAKTVGLILGLGLVFGIGMAVMGGATPAHARVPGKKPEGEDDDDSSPAPTPSDEENAVVVLPGPDGQTGTGPEIEIEEAAEDSDVIPNNIEESPPPPPPAPPAPPVAPPPGTPPADLDKPPIGGDKLAQGPDFAEEVLPEAPDAPPPTEEEKKLIEDLTGGLNPTPIAIEEMSEDMDPHGTIALARLLLTREAMPNWKNDLKEDVKEWQKRVGFTGDDVDGLFGLDAVERMSEEVGILPLVRFYSRKLRSKAEGEREYDRRIRATIFKLEDARPMSEPHIEALKASIERERAQSMGTANPPEQPTLEWVDSVRQEIADTAEAEGTKSLEAS